MKPLTRREVLQWLAGGAVSYVALRNAGDGGTRAALAAPPAPPTPWWQIMPATASHVAIARGGDPAEITRRAVAALGGMERFVKRGQRVIVKPNMCHVTGGVEFATTTNPQVVAALVAMALAAGAKEVQVMDAPFSGQVKQVYARSGIADAVKAAGGKMVAMARMGYAETAIPGGRSMKSWSVYKPALEADVLIDVPIAKHHGSAGLTLGMKNLLGLLEPQGRGRVHNDLHQYIADLSTLIKPALTVVDAVRILMENGPTGGSLDYVKKLDTVVASTDIVAADAYAATLFDKRPDEIPYIAIAASMGIGTADLKKMRIEELCL